MIVGEAPGKWEELDKRPFVGPAGQRLNLFLTHAGLNRAEIYITNVVKCRPPGNREPVLDEISSCLPRFEEELEAVKPNIVVPLGNIALDMLTNLYGITDYRGHIFWSDIYSVKVLPTIHPARTLPGREPLWSDVIISDLKKAKHHSKTPDYHDYNQDTDYILDYDGPWIPKDFFTFDIEATGLNPFHDKILGIGVCTAAGEAFHVEWSDKRFLYIQELLESPVPKGAHNAQYDVKMLRRAGIVVKNLTDDTLLAQALLCAELPVRLSFLNSLYTDYGYYKETNVLLLTPKELAKRACFDADVTYQSTFPLRKDLKEAGLLNVYTRHTIPMINVLVDMELYGIKLDPQAHEEGIETIGKEVENFAEVFQILGIYAQRDISNIKLRKLLFDHWKLPVIKRGKTGPSADKEVLKELASRFEGSDYGNIIKSILNYRRYNKLLSGFLRPFAKATIDGRVYSSYYQAKDIESETGTATGRMSSDHPDLQNIPESIRNIFIPDDGLMWAKFDFQRIELKIMAILAEDEELWTWADSEDPHEQMREIMFGPRPSIETSSDVDYLLTHTGQRRAAKEIVFGVPYGLSPRTIARKYRKKETFARALLDNLFQRYPSLLRLRKKILTQVEDNGYLQTVFGRIREFPHGAYGEALNFPIQSCAADILYRAAVSIYEFLHGSMYEPRILTMVHDEIDVQIEDEDWKTGEKIRIAMEQPFPELGGKVFTVKCSVGPNWRDLREVEI